MSDLLNIIFKKFSYNILILETGTIAVLTSYKKRMLISLASSFCAINASKGAKTLLIARLSSSHK